MIRIARPFVTAGAAALLSAALMLSPLGAAAQQSTQPAQPMKPAAQAPVKSAAPSAEKASARKTTGLSRRAVEIVQAALSNAGYKVEIDGKLDAKTRKALKKYQADHKLKATGTINSATLKSLNIKSLNKWS